MVRDLNIAVEIVIVPTVREPDGLAKSSRNVYLDPAQRAAAPVLYRALQYAATLFQQGERDAATLRAVLLRTLQEQPLAVVEYVSIAELATLVEIAGSIQRAALVSLAVRLGATRLIDNIVLEPDASAQP